MITKIKMEQVASFKNATTLETDKKINLVYGLNGTGKSTVSDYLYDQTNPRFKNCYIEGLNDEEVLVYNQQFIKDYFYEDNKLDGIFTLSKENKDAEEAVKKAEIEIKRFEVDKKNKTDEKILKEKDLAQKKQAAEVKTWEIKTKYAGGDRVLEYCLEGLKAQKNKLLNHLLSITKPPEQPTKTIKQIKKEVESIQGATAQKHDLLPKVNFTAQAVELSPLSQKSIIGNENSTVAELIKSLGNSDWVKQGLAYIPTDINDTNEHCPFCQENTINKTLVENIQGYFDQTYTNDINDLKNLLSEYQTAINSLTKKETYESSPLIPENKDRFNSLYNAVMQCLNSNKEMLNKKLKAPSQEVTLSESNNIINTFNLFIEETNKAIAEHNNKIDNKNVALSKIKKQFWDVMRWDYDQTLSAYTIDKTKIEKEINGLKDKLDSIKKNTNDQKQIITEQQKKTVNIDEAIININQGLIDLGIDGFEIKKHSGSDILYQIERVEQCDNTFHTLSEGEKMLISFLYFRELCKGKKTADSHSSRKIIVIDDPISSLSHIYIFNIGQLIKNDFFKSSHYDQIFLLTHSLYFFYEMADPNHERRKRNQTLFRLIKNCNGSQILEMKYDEIQNDYHSYWSIIKDESHPPALIANCMRNVVEYFFGFIEKKDLNNVFQKPEFKETKYQAFCRYISRESHSEGKNIFDLKEFDYNHFKEGLALVFTESGYKSHYEVMISD